MMICALLIAPSISIAGTFSVTDVTIESTGIGYIGPLASHSEVVEKLGANWVRWSASGELGGGTSGAFTASVQAQPRFKWKVEFTPAYAGELPPSQAHCKLRMMGFGETEVFLSGYPGTWGTGGGASAMVAAWPGNSPACSVPTPSSSMIVSASDGFAAPYQVLTDGYVNTGAFTWNAASGRWVAYAEQTFVGSVQLSLHFGSISYPGKWGFSNGYFDQKTAIYEIDGQSISI